MGRIKEINQENETLRRIVQELFWMARRYAHGRHTFSPITVREIYHQIVKMGIEVKHDVVIQPPEPDEVGGMKFRDDWLDDTNRGCREVK